jgi:hypothetical protein
MSVRRALAVVLAVLMSGCASEVVRTPAQLSPPSADHRARLEIAEESRVELSTGYTRVLPRGSIWEVRGSVPQGTVYRRADGIFTVEGTHVHEAYLVLAGDRLVGFYLPVEQAYSPAKPQMLKLR